MKAWTQLSVALAAMTASMAWADFDGPAPVAWRWAQSTTASPTGTPLVSGDTVFAAVGGRVYAVERASGNQVWRFPVAEPLPANFTKGASLGNGVVIAAADNRTVYAIDQATGTMKWSYMAPQALSGAPIAVGNKVVVGMMPGSLMALDAATGLPSWSAPLDLKSSLLPNMAAWQDNVIVATNAPSFVCVNTASQKSVWRVNSSTISGNAAPTVFGDTVYINTGNYLTALSAGNGGRRWEKRMDKTLAFAPAASDAGVAVTSTDGTVYTLDTRGNFVIRNGVDLKSSPVASPSFVGKMVVVGTDNGSLNVVNPQSGDVVFNYVVPPLFRGAKVEGETNEIRAVPVAGRAVAAGDTMLVLVRDGSMLAFDKTLGVDLTAPKTTMIWPNAGEQVSGQPPLEIWFTIEDAASGINPDSVKVKINGTEYGGVFNRDGYLYVRISAVGNNRPLMDGRAEIEVIAADWLGNSTSSKYFLTIDNNLSPIGGPPRREDSTTGGGARGGGKRGGGGGGPGGGTGG